MRVLIACETSGIVRRAFLAKGHDAWSCDLLPSEDRSNRHIVGDAREILHDGWDLLMVAHPPCTRLCNSGVRWLVNPPPGKTLADMQRELEEGAALFSDFWNADIDRICIENPIMHGRAKPLIRNFVPHTQIVQPYEHGHGETKRICLWLKRLPLLTATKLVSGREARVHRATGWGKHAETRWKERSRFYTGVASAMADQWHEDELMIVERSA